MEEFILKPTTEYINAEESIAAFEKHIGHPLSKNAAGIIREFVPLINNAYDAGYHAALEELSEK